jgi:phosphoglycerate kinase
MTKYVKQAAAGLLMEKELEYLGKVLKSPQRPLVTILGGAKVSDKIAVIRNLMERVNVMLIGGAMAYTFLKAEGCPVGKSLVENDKLELAKEVLAIAEKRGIRFLLPVDHVVAARPEPGVRSHIVGPGESIPAELMGLDIGPRTVELFETEIETAKMIVWNGPMGVFEVEPFSKGTVAIAQAVAANVAATSIVGGGDSVAAVKKAGVADRITHISTGGGASLEFLEGRQLPGVEALTDK